MTDSASKQGFRVGLGFEPEFGVRVTVRVRRLYAEKQRTDFDRQQVLYFHLTTLKVFTRAAN